MKIAIVGDSFSSDSQQYSWIDRLSCKHQITNFSYRGISQYRLFENFQKNLTEILNHDAILVWHTSLSRIYVNDLVDFPTRRLHSHPYADLLVNDSLSSSDLNWAELAKKYYKYFYSHSQQHFLHCMIRNEIRKLSQGIKLIECTGFDFDDDLVKSFYHMMSSHPGKINHFDIIGNQIIYEYIQSRL